MERSDGEQDMLRGLHLKKMWREITRTIISTIGDVQKIGEKFYFTFEGRFAKKFEIFVLNLNSIFFKILKLFLKQKNLIKINFYQNLAIN